jgi:UDP-N-acetylglucosamine 4,6-dehydratase/5-epimerase
MIEGANILVTGGAGFFGKAFVRRVLESGADKVAVFSRDEMKHAQMAEEFHHPKLRMFIGDVRDRDRLRRAMDGMDLVVHAAALKRIQTGFYDPIELVKTNVLGAVNVIEAAIDSKVKKVIALSTDKAFQPVSGYGHSKALAESLFIAANNIAGKKGPKFSLCRYGNVAGSTGSVIPIWRKMAAAGQTLVPVSDPNVTRFWMNIDQAIDLVLDTANSMRGGELNIPELPAYRLGDLAEAMNLKMDIVGLGKFEKLHESMQEGMSSEHARRMTVEELREKLNHV